MNPTIDLKPCPFCGGNPFFDHDDSGWNWIECSQCHVSSKAGTHAMDDCRPMLAESWNTRVNPAAILGKEGGKKSRRTLTTEQSKAMIEAREAKRKQRIQNEPQ